MNQYTLLSKAYSLLDKLYFEEKGNNPREIIKSLIPDENIRVLDMCCGTLSNSLKLAADKPSIQVVGLDVSRAMLKKAHENVKDMQLDNVVLKCADAAATGIKEASFDYIIVGLVLHEISPKLADGILEEAYRLLKPQGRLIILEWDEQFEVRRRIKFAPIYFMEWLGCRTFLQCYKSDKMIYAEQFGFKRVKQFHCNYSVVMELYK